MSQNPVQKLAEYLAFVEHVANTGRFSEECLKMGVLPLKVHFYSPIPDINDLEERNVWSQRSEAVGLRLDADKQLQFLTEISEKYGKETDWPDEANDNPGQYHNCNSSFCHYCASSTHYIVRHFKPARIIEVGSGMSSRVLAAAARKNAEETGVTVNYQIVEPYPISELTLIPGVTECVLKRAELMPPSFYETLKSNDILFIDSSHVVKTGGELNYLILEILPRLKPGVVIHFHDIPLPYEYGKEYMTTPGFRMFWTESYMLQAFLSGNRDYEVLLGMCFLARTRSDEFHKRFPNRKPTSGTSGSFWIRRVTG